MENRFSQPKWRHRRAVRDVWRDFPLTWKLCEKPIAAPLIDKRATTTTIWRKNLLDFSCGAALIQNKLGCQQSFPVWVVFIFWLFFCFFSIWFDLIFHNFRNNKRRHEPFTWIQFRFNKFSFKFNDAIISNDITHDNHRSFP